MPDLVDCDAVTKEIKKLFDAWSKAAQEATTALAKLKADADKDEVKKQQEAAKKAVQQATDAMQKKIYNFSISPKADPKPFANLPKIIKDIADKCEIKFGDSCVGVVPKDIKIDPPPKFRIKSGGFIVEWTLKF